MFPPPKESAELNLIQQLAVHLQQKNILTANESTTTAKILDKARRFASVDGLKLGKNVITKQKRTIIRL